LVVFTLFTQIVLKSIRRATAVVRQSEARFRDIAEAASDWIWETDRRLLLTYVSEHFGGATGLNPADVLEQPLHRVLELCDQSQRVQQEASLRAGRAFRDVLCQLHPDGGKNTRTLRVAGKPIHDGAGDFHGYRGTATDITSEIAALRQVQFLAHHDPLTKLPNRAVFHDRLAEVLNRCGRSHEQAAVLCIDLDRFKEVNDSLGHAAGDQVLMECAERLRGCVRETDLVARLGGDEFAVLLAGVTTASDVQALCERVLTTLAEPFQVEGTETVVGASVGVGLIPAKGSNAARVLQNADVALYRAKADGRNRACFFQNGMGEGLRRRKSLETALRHALGTGQLELHYQPQVTLDAAAMFGVEALLRWRHPERGSIAPTEFIPIAEESGLIVPIGEWVLRTACREAARWPGLTVSVNVSPVQFRQGDLVRSVESALSAAELQADRLEIEITEGVLFQNTVETLRTLAQLKAIGIRIAMDDFGTGYSSLSYLQKFPLDKLKIDRAQPGHGDLRRGCRDGRASESATPGGLPSGPGLQVRPRHAARDDRPTRSGNGPSPPSSPSRRRLSSPRFGSPRRRTIACADGMLSNTAIGPVSNVAAARLGVLSSGLFQALFLRPPTRTGRCAAVGFGSGAAGAGAGLRPSPICLASAERCSA
jgi:diguanylate cyclase (GGDEF)-like protein/PAS domain S-box-containing protein